MLIDQKSSPNNPPAPKSTSSSSSTSTFFSSCFGASLATLFPDEDPAPPPKDKDPTLVNPAAMT